MAIQVDAYLDPVTGDLPAVSRFTTGMELIEQRIRLRLRRGLGEWFLDPVGVGLPLLEWRQQKPPDVPVIVARIQTEIRTIPGVTSTRGFNGVHDPRARQLVISGDVTAADGQVTSLIVIPPSTERNSSQFVISFRRGVGPIVRPPFQGP